MKNTLGGLGRFISQKAVIIHQNNHFLFSLSQEKTRLPLSSLISGQNFKPGYISSLFSIEKFKPGNLSSLVSGEKSQEKGISRVKVSFQKKDLRSKTNLRRNNSGVKKNLRSKKISELNVSFPEKDLRSKKSQEKKIS